MSIAPGQQRPIFQRSRERAAGQVSRAGSCPVCGRHDAVRQLHAIYQDRRRHMPEPPLVTRYGLMMRGAALLMTMPRTPARVPPPRRPSLFGAYIGLHGFQVPLALTALLLAFGALIETSVALTFEVTTAVAFFAGLLGEPLHRRGKQRWNARLAEWDKAMQAWRGLRYCSRCDHLFRRD
ncbi:MAG: hypothetical protein JOY61_20505 [Chloroflexi bacterium]|nr:hypothetical protein [Chloroflexota bacterium]